MGKIWANGIKRWANGQIMFICKSLETKGLTRCERGGMVDALDLKTNPYKCPELSR